MKRLTLPLLLLCLTPASSGLAQDPPSEQSMALYADAANFQTGGAIKIAIETWNKFLAEYPGHPMAAEAAHFLGVCHMQKDQPDYVAASKAFERALKKKKYDLREESLVNYGWCLYASAGQGEQRDQKRLQQVIDAFETLRQENPKSQFLDRALFYSGEAAYGLGQAKRAIEFYDQMLSMRNANESPLRCDALYARGVAHEELKQVDQALNSYSQLLDSCDREGLVTDVHLRLGDLMILQRNFPEAIKSFEGAFASTQSDEDRAYALFRQAYALVQDDKPAEAAATYERLLSDYPKSKYVGAAVLASAQSSYRSGDIDAAEQRFQRVLSQTNLGAATEAAHWLARIKIRQGKAADAVRLAREQLERGVEGEFSNDLKLDLAEALSLDPAGVEESLALFEKVYRDAPGDGLAPRALYNAAFSALQLGRPNRALELALEFIQKFPEDTLAADTRFVAAESQWLTGNVKHAAGTYQKLLAMTSEENVQRPMWLLRAGAAYNAAEEFEDTIALLTREIDRLAEPSQKAEAQLLIGQAHFRSGSPKEAAESFLRSHQVDPDGPRADEALLAAGQSQLASGDASAAQATWQQLIRNSESSPAAAQARYQLGQLASSDQRFGEAVKYFDRILDSKNQPNLVPYARYGKGWALLQSEQYEQALESLHQMLEEAEQHPLAGDAMLARGIALRNLGKLSMARADFDRYLEVPPTGVNLGHALYELALIDQEEKNPEKAAEKLARLVREVPDYPSMDRVLYELGWSLQQSGNDDAAARHFRTLISKYPNTPMVAEAAYFVGQQHYSAMQWDRAAAQFQIAAQKATDKSLSEKAHYRLGWSHFKAENYEASEQAFSRQRQKHADGAFAFDATMMAGECRFKRKEFGEALAAYDIARDMIRRGDERSSNVKDDAERQVREVTLLHGGQSAAQLKQWETAIEWYDELRDRFPTSDYLPQVFYETGFAYQQQNDSANALRFFREVADNYRNELAARARFMMGEIYFANRQFDKAIPEFQRVMYGFGADKAPDAFKNWQAKSGFEAARCSELLMQQAKTDAARQKAQELAQRFFRYVIQQHPSHELAVNSRKRLEALKQ